MRLKGATEAARGYNTRMYSAFSAFLALYLSFVPVSSQPVSVELLSVFAEGSATVKNANYLSARNVAMKKALGKALLSVAGILVSPDQMELNRDVIQEMINSRAMDFVQSYKFIKEEVDEENGLYKLDLQVTFFKGHFRASLMQVGLAMDSGDKPKVVLIIDERAMGVVPDSNFLLLPSNAEKGLKELVSSLGFSIVDRAKIRGLKDDQRVLRAVNGDIASVRWLSEQYGASYIILGRARSVPSSAMDKGPKSVDGEISAKIYDGRSASVLWEDKVTHRVEGGSATGGFKAIRLAAEELNRRVVEFIYNRTVQR